MSHHWLSYLFYFLVLSKNDITFYIIFFGLFSSLCQQNNVWMLAEGRQVQFAALITEMQKL